MQTILGAGGAIGVELAKALPAYTSKIRLVSRNPKRINSTDELMQADLTKEQEVLKAVEGSEIVYLTVGLPYNTKLWQEKWPLVMQNTINACLRYKAKLVFFDNIYMYDGTHLNPIKEDHPIGPPSKKGKVRAKIEQMLWQAVENEDLQALIARSADFYGPSIEGTSVLTETVIKPLSQGKTATWLGSDKFKHSYTYTIDAGKATALLGNTESAYGEVWHLPTAPNPYTGKEWVHTIAQTLHVKPKYRVANKFMLRVLGVFVPVMKEMVEMLYQNNRDYVFNSDKFEKRFNFKPTPYTTGIKEIIRADFKK